MSRKYTARRDLTADGVDFESLCEWTNNYERLPLVIHIQKEQDDKTNDCS